MNEPTAEFFRQYDLLFVCVCVWKGKEYLSPMAGVVSRNVQP